MPNDYIGGTVIQRSFVGRGVANVVHIATVPTDELQITADSFEDVVAELLAVPSEAILTEKNYSQVIQNIRKNTPEDLLFFWHPRIEREYFRLVEAASPEVNAQMFIGDFISLISAPVSAQNIFPFVYPYHSERQLEIGDDAFHLALSCLSSRLQKRREAEVFYKEMLRYDIPLGQSPETKGDSLLKLLETSKKVCLAPLALGGAQGVNLLAQGNYVAAILTTGTAGAMTLVLIGTVSVGSIIVQKVAQHRK
jgi:hypothetical protein